MKSVFQKSGAALCMVSVLAAMYVLAGSSPAQAASKASLREKLKGATDEGIRAFVYTDLNGDGRKEALAVTSKETDESGYEDAKVWYVSDTACDAFYESGGDYLYDSTWKLYPLKGTKMLCYDVGAGGSGYTSYAWTFGKNGPEAVENAMSGVRQIKGNEFVLLDSQYDACTDNTGHTWNQYYARWDGEKLVEYGGLKISGAQLKKAKNGAKILKDVKIYGRIQSIYYRANGMVFLNLCDGSRNRNVALTLKNGKLFYYDYGNGGTGSTALERATADGVIHKSITTCVKYPKSFPMNKKAE